LRRRRKAEEQEIKKLQIFRKTTYPSRNFPDTNIAEKKKSGGTGNKKNHKSSGKPHTRRRTSLTQTLRRRRKAEEQEIKKYKSSEKPHTRCGTSLIQTLRQKHRIFFISPLFRKRKPATAANIRRHFPYSYTHFPVLFFPLIILLSHTILSSTAAMRTSPLH